MPDPNESRPLHVLAVDPFHGGSHRCFLDGAVRHSRHQWTLVTGKPVHWKWRMRSAPLAMADAAISAIASNGYPDVVFCSDMLDLAQWRGMLRDPVILKTPTAVYFHENQWTYPVAPEARVDFHFGYTNLLTAITADACWFNSAFHRDDFIEASKSFLQRMPDARGAHDLAQLQRKCQVIPPGFEARDSEPVDIPTARSADQSLTIGWVSRWEHDKRPDRFVTLVSQLAEQEIDFQLVLLGSRPRRIPAALTELRDRFSQRIIHDAYAETSQEYWSLLRAMDIVVSTADHEFFGIAVCEAIWAGANPVLPNRLSYPELVSRECLYDSLDEAVTMIKNLCDADVRLSRSDACRQSLQQLRMERTVARLDDALRDLADSPGDE